MKLTYTITIIICFSFLLSCKKKPTIIYSADEKQSITIIEDGGMRYIIAGETYSVPDTNYVRLKLDENTSKNDELAGCWKKNNHEWELIINGAEILENKLDTTKYVFYNKLPLDTYLKIPSLKGYSESPCFHFGFEMYSVVPKNGAIIK